MRPPVRTRVLCLKLYYISYTTLLLRATVLGGCFTSGESTAMRSSTTRCRFVRGPPSPASRRRREGAPSARQRSRRRRAGTPSTRLAHYCIRHNPVTPDGGGGTRKRDHNTARLTRSAPPTSSRGPGAAPSTGSPTPYHHGRGGRTSAPDPASLYLNRATSRRRTCRTARRASAP